MYKNYFLTILAGVLLALAWPTYGFPLLLFVAFVPLLIAEKNIRDSSNKYKNTHTFFSTYLGFLIWNLITTWWIWNSTHEGAIFAFVVNTLLMTLVFQLYHVIAKRKPQRFSLIFLVAIWIAFEKFHLNWEFSWPWLNLGNAFSEYPQWIQWYEYTGVFGGSLWVWMVNVLIFVAINYFLVNRNKQQLIKRIVLAISIVILGVFSSLYRYYTYKEQGEKVTALLLQPNTDPYSEKYHQSDVKIANNLLNQIQEKMTPDVQLIVAPETVFSNHAQLNVFKNSKAYLSLQKFLLDYPQTAFLSGISLIKSYDDKTPRSDTAISYTNSEKMWYEIFNAAIFVESNRLPQKYYKSKLVVGIEHFPFRSILRPLLGDLMIDLGGTVSTLTTQKEVSIFTSKDKKIKAAPIICYESIYGEYVGKYVQKGASVLAIITNDSWWGRTQGHKQLLSYARLRSVENRRAIARSANSGISAFINQRGDVLSRLEYETKGVLKGSIHANTQMTFYSKQGDIIARAASFVAVLFLLVGLFVKKRM